MNLLQRIFARLTRAEQPTDKRVYWSRAENGVWVTADNALQTATVWACVTYLGRTVAQLPWRVLLPRDGEGGADPQPTHPVARLLHRRPNPEMGAFSFRETMVGWAALQGNAIAELTFDVRGVPIALWPIHPSRVSFRRDLGDDLIYEIDNELRPPTRLTTDQVFHLRGYGDGAIGLSVFEYAARSIGWARATEIFGSTFFSEGASPTSVLKTQNKMTVEGLGLLRKQFKNLYTGTKAERTVVLDAGMEWQAVSTAPEQAQFIETRQHQVEEICRWFGVPPHKVQHLLRATFSNIEHQSIEVVVDSITPWVRRLEDEADYKMFGSNRPGYFTKLDLKGLLRGDFQSRSAGYQILAQLGVLSINEIRQLEDMNPIGADGDKRMVPMNMTTLKKLGQDAPAPSSAPTIDVTPTDEPSRPAKNLRLIGE